MAQWGAPGRFTRGHSSVEVVPDVDTGKNPFNPIGGGSTIRDIFATSIKGKEAAALLADVKKEFVGQPYLAWEQRTTER